MFRPYSIFETEPFSRRLGAFAGPVKKRLETKLREHVYPVLRQEPHFGPNIKRLRNWDPPTWRYRVGEWRIFYEIDEAAHWVLITAVEHRKEAYRQERQGNARVAEAVDTRLAGAKPCNTPRVR